MGFQTHLKKKQRRQLIRITEYMVSGGAYFWTGYFIIVFLTPVIGLWWANLLGNGLGVTVNFVLQRYWVFDDNKRQPLGSATWRYVVYTGLNFILNYIILRVLLHFGVPVAIGQFVAAGFFTVWNYVWYQHWVFKKDKKPIRRVHHHA